MACVVQPSGSAEVKVSVQIKTAKIKAVTWILHRTLQLR